MSAQLVSNLDRDENGERIPMPAERAETLANIPQFAESLERLLLRDSRDGQLWERVAETPSNAPAPLTARQDAGIVRAYAGHCGDRGFRICDPSARRHERHTHPNAHGIIRAGQRIR